MEAFDFISNSGMSDEVIDSFHTDADTKKKAILERIESYSLEIQNPVLDINLGEVTVSGLVADQDTREKIILVIGNLQGVFRVNDHMEIAGKGERISDSGGHPVQNQALRPNFYSVSSNDTLDTIAEKFFGDASKSILIFEANRPLLEQPDQIYRGQVLRIPRIDQRT